MRWKGEWGLEDEVERIGSEAWGLLLGLLCSLGRCFDRCAGVEAWL
jgi:hypothetical protein